jgi:hypothetical protein
MLSAMAYDALPEMEGRTMGMNYGFDKIRFLAPVPAGSKNPRPLHNHRRDAQSESSRRALRRQHRDRRPRQAGCLPRNG